MADLFSAYCPHCQKYTSFSPAPVEYSDNYGLKRTVDAIWKNNVSALWWIGVCNACRGPILIKNRGDQVFPHPLPKPSEPAIPDAIRADLDEAKLCESVGAIRGASVLARRAIQSACIDQGALGDKLVVQIQQLQSAGKITNEIKDWADAVRWIGNDAAHPGDRPVTRDDARDVIHLAEQLLHVLYVAPALASALRFRLNKS